MFKHIGITGGIASGKSTVSNYLKDKGYIVLDADVYARNVLNKGTEGLRQVAECFGESVLEDDGSLNRKKLGDIVFNDKKALDKLNNITHPIIRKEMDDAKDKYIEKSHVFSDIPLLFENELENQFDTIITVYVDRDTQLDRLMKRNNFSKEEALSRINSQMDLDVKKEKADIVFINNQTKKELYEQIDRFLEQL